MKTHLLLLILSSLLSITLIHAQSPPSTMLQASSPPSNMTLGSSLLASQNNTSSHLLSPSGTFAFGFKSLGPNTGEYKIGIWIANSSEKTLVWVPNPSRDEPIDTDSSIVLNNHGVFMLKKFGYTEEPLVNTNYSGRGFYAAIHDTGNLVVYNSDSEILWQSFDYPTDTILQSQTLKSRHTLVAKTSDYDVIMKEHGDLVVRYREYYMGRFNWYLKWSSKTGNVGSPVVLKLDATGRFYLVDWDLEVIKNFTTGEDKQIVGNTIYRATMDSDGIFRLYGERIGYEAGNRVVVLWKSGCIPCHDQRESERKFFTFLAIVFACIGCIIVFLIVCENHKSLGEFLGSIGRGIQGKLAIVRKQGYDIL